MSQSGENGNDEPGKMFVGGLSWTTTAENLKAYFSAYGEVDECLVMYDRVTMRSRGYGYIKFKDPNSVNQVMSTRPHIVDGKQIDPKPCCPRGMEKMIKQCKVFLGGLPLDADETAVKDFFEQFGKVVEAQVMYNVDKKRSRGFGFVAFENESVVNQLLEQRYVDFNGKQVEIRRLETSAARRARAQQQQPMGDGGYGYDPRARGGYGSGMYDNRSASMMQPQAQQMVQTAGQWGYAAPTPYQAGPGKWQPAPAAMNNMAPPTGLYNAATGQWQQAVGQWGAPAAGPQPGGPYGPAQFGAAPAAQQAGPYGPGPQLNVAATASQPWQQSGNLRAYQASTQQAGGQAQWGFAAGAVQAGQSGWQQSNFAAGAGGAAGWQASQGGQQAGQAQPQGQQRKAATQGWNGQE